MTFFPFKAASSVSGITPQDEERLRRKLAFFFMDPVRKFIAKRQVSAHSQSMKGFSAIKYLIYEVGIGSGVRGFVYSPQTKLK